MSKLVLLFVCVAYLQIASALQCYNCRGSSCDTDTKLWEKTMCGASGVQPPANHEYACLKLNYKDRVSQKEMVTRKCVLAEKVGSKLNFNCPQTEGEPISCPICTGDLCNSAHSVSFSFFAVSAAVFASLLAKFL